MIFSLLVNIVLFIWLLSSGKIFAEPKTMLQKITLRQLVPSIRLSILIILTAFSLVVGLYGINDFQKLDQNTQTLYADRMACTYQLANMRLQYTGEIAPIALRVKNHLLTFDQAAQRTSKARLIIDSNWHNYELTHLTTEEKSLARQTDALKKIADQQTQILQSILKNRDTAGLDELIKQQKPAGQTAFLLKLTQLMDLQQRLGKQIFENSKHTYTAASKGFDIWIIISLAIILASSFLIIKNIRRVIKEISVSHARIKLNENYYRSILQNASDAIYLADNKGNFIDLSQSMCTMLAYSKEDLLRLNFSDIIDPENLKTNPIERPAITNQPITKERIFITREGKKVEVEISGQWVSENTLMGVARDITERKRMEAELREAEMKFRILAEQSMVGVYLSQNQELRYVNQRFAEILGYQPEEIIAMKDKVIDQIYDQKNQDIIKANLQARYGGGNGRTHYEVEGIKKDGTLSNIEVFGNIVTIDGQPATVGTILDITERKRMERELKEAEMKFRMLAEKSMVGVYITQNKRFLYANPRFAEIFGYPLPDLMNLSNGVIDTIYAEESRALVREKIRARDNGETEGAHYEAVGLKKDGARTHVEFYGTRVNINGQPATIGTMLDITERKTAEKEIHRLTRLYQFISSINESMLKAEDAGQVYADACRIAVEIGGFQMAWIGTYDKKNDRIIPVAWSGHQDGFFDKIDIAGMKVSLSAIPSARAIREGTHFYYNDIANDPDIPTPIKHEMVQRGYLSGVSFPIIFDGEVVAAMVLLMSEAFFFNEEEIELLHDVTSNIIYALDKIKIQAQKGQSEANLRSIFNTTNVSYLLLDTHYRIISLNQQMKDVYRTAAGIELKEGDNFIGLLLPEKRENAQAGYDRIIQTNRSEDYETTYERNGRCWHYLANVKPIHDGKKVIGICISAIDITERRNALENLKSAHIDLQKKTKELELSNTELEQFAYVASHDLQEPLRMVTSFLTQLEKKYGHVLDEKGKKYMYFATDGAKRMRQLILDLLEFSRVGRMEDNPEEVDFNSLVNEVLALYRRNIEQLRARIRCVGLPTLRIYKTPVRQVFQNLLGNALKYHQPGLAPLIEISSRETLAGFEFSIKDNGIGIDPEYFEQIFIIFKRLHHREIYSGTGMGLAITKKIVESMGGRIWVESSEGEGAVFYFTIPKDLSYETNPYFADRRQ